MRSTWRLEVTNSVGEYQPLKRDYSSAKEASEAAGKSLLLAASRGTFRNFAVRLVRVDPPKEKPVPVVRRESVTLPNGTVYSFLSQGWRK